MPDIISKIKEEVITESKIREPKKIQEQVKPTIIAQDKPIEKEEISTEIVHSRVTCDECGTNPIVGIRYKCVVCPDFDLCEKCESKSIHDHPFLKIKKLKHTPMKIIAVIDD